jgi:hypothetical protein
MDNELKLIENTEQIRRQIGVFKDELARHPQWVRRLLANTDRWIFDPDLDNFGPLTFVGFQNLSMERYEVATQGQSSGIAFRGSPIKDRLKQLLELELASDEELGIRFLEWSRELSAKPDDIREKPIEVRTDHLTFISLPRESGTSGKPQIRRGEAGRAYWALLCNPDKYDIRGALSELQVDLWRVGKSDVRVGDRFLIWKSLGRERTRA